MPTLPATGYPYKPYASETPSTTVPTAYQDVRAPVDAFGAGIGQALSGLGQQFERTGDTLASIALQRQQLYNEIAADDQINQAQERINKLIYGDPDIPGDTGFKGKRGRNALDEFPNVRRQIEETLKASRGTLRNPQQQQRFDAATRGFKNSVLSETGRHYDREFHAFAEEEAQGRLKLDFGSLSTAAAEGNFAAFRTFLGKTLLDIEERGTRLSRPREAIEAEKQAASKLAAKEWAESLSVKDPLAAQQFIDNNKDVLQDLYPDLAARVKAKALSQQALEIVTGTSKPRSTELVRGGAIERFLDLANQEESGDRNIEQQIVPPGGGFNPSVGRVTGPSTASGYWQITDTTWARFAPQIGVDTKQFPRAMSASKEIQRNVARHIATTDGVQHWTDYNKALRAKVQQEGLPVKGAIAAQPVQMADADELIKNLPPREDGQLSDDQVPGLQQRLQEMAKRIPKDAPPDLWWASVKLARQMMNMQYTDTMNAQRLRDMQQRKRDQELANEFMSRMAPNSANFPTSQEILTNPELLPETKRTLTSFLTRELLPGPDSRTANKNHAELFARIHLPDDHPDKIRDEQTLRNAYAVERRVNYDGFVTLLANFREANGASTKIIADAKADLIRAVTPRVRPFVGQEAENFADPEWGNRVYRLERRIDKEIQESYKQNKNPMELFDPKSPRFLGAPEFIKEFEKGGPSLRSKLQDGAKITEPKTVDEVVKALGQGFFGNPNSPGAREAARTYLRDRGLVRTNQPVPLSVPIR